MDEFSKYGEVKDVFLKPNCEPGRHRSPFVKKYDQTMELHVANWVVVSHIFLCSPQKLGKMYPF